MSFARPATLEHAPDHLAARPWCVQAGGTDVYPAAHVDRAITPKRVEGGIALAPMEDNRLDQSQDLRAHLIPTICKLPASPDRISTAITARARSIAKRTKP